MANVMLPHDSDSTQDSDSAIVAMIDELLAQDDLYVLTGGSSYHLCEKRVDTEGFSYYENIDTYETRGAAYRGAIDCIIELCIEAWDGAE